MITYGAWICLAAPLAGAILITLGGTRLPRSLAGIVATTSTAVAFPTSSRSVTWGLPLSTRQPAGPAIVIPVKSPADDPSARRDASTVPPIETPPSVLIEYP